MWFQLCLLLLDGVDIVDSPSQTSDFTQHNWEIYMDARVIQLYNSLHGQKIEKNIYYIYCHSGSLATVLSIKLQVIKKRPHLRCQVFLNLSQLGFLLSIFCHNCLFIKLVGQVTILIKEHGAAECPDTNSEQHE